MVSDLSLEISTLEEETVFEKLISSPKNMLIMEKSKISSPVLKPTEDLTESNNDPKTDTGDTYSTVIAQAVINTAENENNTQSVVAVPFSSCAIESIFRSFPFAQQDQYPKTQISTIRQEEGVSEGTYASTVPDIVTQIARTIDASTELTSQDFQNDESYLLKQKYLSDLQQALDCNTQGHLLRLRRDLSGAVKLYQNSIQQLDRLIDHLPVHSSTPAVQNPIHPSITTETTTMVNHESHSNALTYVYYECLNNLAEVLLEQLLIEQRHMNYHLDINFTDEVDRELLSFKRSAAVQEQYEVIIALYRRILKGKRRMFGPHHVQALRIQYFIAVVLTEKGSLKESEHILRYILARFEHDNTSSLDELAVASKLGQVLMWNLEIDEASNLMQRCSIAYESLEGDSVSIGAWENMHRYANLLTLRTTDTSSQSEAESIYRKLISGREKFFGFRDVRTLVSVFCLAKLLSVGGEGQVKEAVDLFKRVVTDSEIGLGEEHPFTLTCVHDMADCLAFSLKDFGSAEVMYRRAIAGRRKALGSDHPDTLLSGQQLVVLILLIQKSKSSTDSGDHHHDLQPGEHVERLDEAEELIRTVVAGRARCFGERHALTLEATSHWAAVLRSDGRYLEAENLLLRAYEGLKATASSTTTTTPTDNNASAGSSRSDAREKQLCETARALGDLYIHQLLNYNKAAEYLQVCYFGYNRLLGIDHNLTLAVKSEWDSAKSMIHGNALLRQDDAMSRKAPTSASSVSPPSSSSSSPTPPSGPRSSQSLTLLSVHRNWRLL